MMLQAVQSTQTQGCALFGCPTYHVTVTDVNTVTSEADRTQPP